MLSIRPARFPALPWKERMVGGLAPPSLVVNNTSSTGTPARAVSTSWLKRSGKEISRSSNSRRSSTASSRPTRTALSSPHAVSQVSITRPEQKPAYRIRPKRARSHNRRARRTRHSRPAAPCAGLHRDFVAEDALLPRRKRLCPHDLRGRLREAVVGFVLGVVQGAADARACAKRHLDRRRTFVHDRQLNLQISLAEAPAPTRLDGVADAVRQGIRTRADGLLGRGWSEHQEQNCQRQQRAH